MAIKAVLFDLDGVLYTGNEIIRGAVEAVQYIHDLGLPLAGLTNTTTQSRRMIADKLNHLGIAIAATDIYTPRSTGCASHRIAQRQTLCARCPAGRFSRRSNKRYTAAFYCHG